MKTVFIKAPCRVCNGKTYKEIAYNRVFMHCQECNFIFSGDYPEFLANVGMGMSGSWGGAEKGGEREDYLARMISSSFGKKKILLYGVGSTLAFPVLLREGFQVHGCDVSDEVIKYRQAQFGFDLFYHARDLVIKKNQYDAIIACEVFEHFCDPIKWVDKIMGSLNSGGIVCGTTNFYLDDGIEDKNSIGYMGLEGHVAYWSEKSMQKLFDRYNAKLISFEMICPGSVKLDPKYNLLFPNKRVFFATTDIESFNKLVNLKNQQSILPIDTSAYNVEAYKS